MKTFFRCLLGFFLSYTTFAVASRDSSAPYISGDSFRLSCDFIYDELDDKMNPLEVKKGNTVFVKTDKLPEFFSLVHPFISAPYILISHNAATGIPGPFEHYLDDPKIIAWFGQNVEKLGLPKLRSIPVGIANRCWGHGNIEMVATAQEKGKGCTKDILLYLNISEWSFPEERTYVAQMFKEKPYCVHSKMKPSPEYLLDLARCKFVLSPRGFGLDCHRTWEVLLMGAIPVLKSCSLDGMYEGLPVLIVKEWTEITEEFLNQKYEEMQSESYSLDKAYFDYWKRLIDKEKKLSL